MANYDLKTNLRKFRIEKGLSQAQLAKILNVAQNTVSNWEKGIREPDLKTTQVLADFFDVSVDYLLGRPDKKTSQKVSDSPLSPHDEETTALLEQLHKRPEMKVLFSVSKKATKEDIERAVKIIEALKDE